VTDMTYLHAAETATHTIISAHAADVETVHVAMELALHGWTRFATDATGPIRWDLLGTAVQQVAASFHYRDPVVILVQTDADEPERAWHATTQLVSAVAEHLDNYFTGQTLPPLPRRHWQESAGVLRTALGALS
jgi:hypothetical protein